MYVKNFSQVILANINGISSDLRMVGWNALELALSSVEPKKLLQNAVKIVEKKLKIQNDTFDLKTFREVLVLGGGKASGQMALAIEELLKEYPKINYKGIINIPNDLGLNIESTSSKMRWNFASHPIPDKNGFFGTKNMYNLIEYTTKDDLIIFLLSGGGSALLPMPKREITLEDLQVTNSLLLDSGASIHEINTVRKHLSDFKGGKLAKKIYESSKATVITLVISDVVRNDLDVIASGPTIPDLTTIKDAYDVIDKYHLISKLPISVKQLIETGMNDSSLNEPLDKRIYFENVHNYLIGSVESSVIEVSNYLKKFNFSVDYFSSEIEGEAADFGKELANIISHKLQDISIKSKRQRIALIGTGELTVTIKGRGTGGRNQEMLLSFLNNIKDKKIDYRFLVIAVNLDGIEGNSKAMGALVDNDLLAQSINKNMNFDSYLDTNDSNHFFQMVKGEIITGATGINVNDLILILIDINE